MLGKNRISEYLPGTQPGNLGLTFEDRPLEEECIEIVQGQGDFTISFVQADDLQALNKKVAAQQDMLEDLQERVLYLQEKIGNSPSYFDVRDAKTQVEAITAEVFPGAPHTVLEVDDCEVENDRHFTFRVMDCANMEDVLQRYHTWHARLSEIPEAVRGMFRLSIDLSQ
jgi:uncharacterized coiled-coil protein SlyX